MHNRRSVLAGSAVLLGLGAGCAEELDNDENGGGNGIMSDPQPEPTVTDVESEQGFLDALSGTAEVRVLVSNQGAAGDVEVTVTLYDGADNTLDRTSKVVNIQEGENRRVDIEVEPPDGTERFSAEANPA